MPSLDAGSRVGDTVGGESVIANPRSPQMMMPEPTGYDVLTRAMKKLKGFDGPFLREFAERPKIWFFQR